MKSRIIFILILLLMLNISFVYGLLPAGWIRHNTDGLIAKVKYSLVNDPELGYIYKAENSSGFYKQYVFYPTIRAKFKHYLLLGGNPANSSSFTLHSGILSLFHQYGNLSFYIMIYMKFDHYADTGNNYYTLMLKKIEYNATEDKIYDTTYELAQISFNLDFVERLTVNHDMRLSFKLIEIKNPETNETEIAQLKLYYKFVVNGTVVDGNSVISQISINELGDTFTFHDVYKGWWVWIGVGYIYTSPIAYMRSYMKPENMTGWDYFIEQISIEALFDGDNEIYKTVLYKPIEEKIDIIILIPIIASIVVTLAFKKEEVTRDYSGYIGCVLGGGLSVLLGYLALGILFFVGILGVYLYETSR